MTKKLVLFDLDGTLLTDEHKVLDSTKEALEELKESGHVVMCATGRSYPLAKEIIEEVGFDNTILNNGAVAFYEGKQVYGNPLDRQAMERFIALNQENDIDLIFHSLKETKRYTESYQPITHDVMTSFGSFVPDYEANYHEDKDIYQIVSIIDEERMTLYGERFPEFRFVRWHEVGLDVLPHNGSKAETIKSVAKQLGISKEDIVAFGDGLNDIEMLDYVGTGVAMGNARPEAKAVSNHVTATNNEHGIAKALKELGLIK